MTNTFVQASATAPFDWTRIIALANAQGRHEFETTVLGADGLSEDQLTHQADDFERRFTRALEAARHNRCDPEPMFLSAMRNWSRGKAIGLLRDRLAGKAIRKDYTEVFEGALKDEIAYRSTDLELAWQSEDEQQRQHAAGARRVEQEQAFQDDHQALLDAYGAVERAYSGREQAVQAGYDLAGRFAQKLEDRMGRHDLFLEAMGGEVLGLVREARVQQRRDDSVSLADHMVRTGKSTLTCLFWLLVGGTVIFLGLFAALYFAFPHH